MKYATLILLWAGFCGGWATAAEPALGGETYVLPADAPYVNVRDKGAKGNGVADDTKAIQAAIASAHDAWEVVYLPAGTYVVSDTIRWGRFITLRGEGPGRTVIKLKNSTPGFGDPARPKPVLFCRLIDDPKTNNNTSHSNHIYHLSIEVGAGNAGAIGIDYASHNGGMVKDVVVSAAEGSGYRGIAMDRNGPGPAMVRDVRVVGFEYGLSTSWGLYSMTFENITVEGQRKAGFRNDGNNPTIRRMVSRNRVPAVEVAKGRDYGLLVLVDSDLRGGASDRAAVESEGEVFVRNVRTDGYGAAVRDGGRVAVPAGDVREYSSSPLQMPTGAVGTSLNLPVKDPPRVPWDADPSQWASVAVYEKLKKGDDWGPAIQAAIDSGKSTVYFPNHTHCPYPAKTPVVVRGGVRRIVGNFATLAGCKVRFENEQPVVVEQVRDCDVVVAGKGAVVIEGSLLGQVRTTPGCGDLFMDDVLCTLDVHRSRVWVRQFNEESQRSPKILNDGGQLWVLNLKTEQGGQILRNVNGARTEILGGVIYPAQGVREGVRVMYENDGTSALCVMHREVGAGYPGFALENGGEVKLKFEHGVRYVAGGVGGERGY